MFKENQLDGSGRTAFPDPVHFYNLVHYFFVVLCVLFNVYILLYLSTGSFFSLCSSCAAISVK